jgi:hypothetical protein
MPPNLLVSCLRSNSNKIAPTADSKGARAIESAQDYGSNFWDTTLGPFIPVHSLRAIARVPAVAGGIIWLFHVEVYSVAGSSGVQERILNEEL